MHVRKRMGNLIFRGSPNTTRISWNICSGRNVFYKSPKIRDMPSLKRQTTHASRIALDTITFQTQSLVVTLTASRYVLQTGMPATNLGQTDLSVLVTENATLGLQPRALFLVTRPEARSEISLTGRRSTALCVYVCCLFVPFEISWTGGCSAAPLIHTWKASPGELHKRFSSRYD